MISSTLKVGAGLVAGQVLYSGTSAVVDYLVHLPEETQEASGHLVGKIMAVGCTAIGVYKLCKLAQSRLLGNNK